MSVIVTIDYEEFGGQDTYECVKIHDMDSHITEVFDTGDFVEDYNNAVNLAREWASEGDGMVLASSTVFDFFEEDPQMYEGVGV